MKYILLLLFFSLTNLNVIHSLDKVNEDFMKYVKQSKTGFEDVQGLHDYLVKPAKNDRERIELFFYWISQHLEYDIEKYELILSGKPVKRYDPFKEKKGVCEDFSSFFKSLCDLSNIECYFVAGYSKGGIYAPGKKLKIDHAWNVVKLGQEYEFVDCTWGSGEVITGSDGKLKYHKDLDLSQILTNSNDFRKFHLPGATKWQLLEFPVSYSAFTENEAYEKMYLATGDKFNFKDSIQQYKNLSNEDQLIKEKIDAYYFNPTYKNAFECGRNHEVVAYRLSKGDFNLENIKRAKKYYETSKKWYVKSFKTTNKDKNKANRSQIEFIKKVNKRIKYCDFRIMSRK